MKNIQVIDGANNCAYFIYAAVEDDFHMIFPGEGQDIEFINDFVKRVGKKAADEICTRLWQSEVDKKNVEGVHGALFYDLDFKKKYYPTKKEKEMLSGI